MYVQNFFKYHSFLFFQKFAVIITMHMIFNRNTIIITQKITSNTTPDVR